MSSAGYQACDKTLSRLIHRAARRVFAADLDDLKATLIGLPATPSSLPEYFNLERFADRQDYHARLNYFINAAAVSAEWDSAAGDQGQLVRIHLTDATVAAELLNTQLPWEVAACAIGKLSAEADGTDIDISHVLTSWQAGRSVNGFCPKKVNQLVDSLRVIKKARELNAEKSDVLLRRVSAQLFNDTKRIESLEKALAFLLKDNDPEVTGHIFARLGLVKHPQPMLLSGSPAIEVVVDGRSIPLATPYLGFRPDKLSSIDDSAKPVRRVITIENLASFNEAAAYHDNPDDLLLIYVAGNPTPSLLSAYQRLLRSIEPASVIHWGDIDMGGFRIAARLSIAAMEAGHKLMLWNMNPARVASSQPQDANQQKISAIESICQLHGWHDEIQGLKSHPSFQEQEFIVWDPREL